MYPEAEKIFLVMDNLNTHKPASLYKKYPAAEATHYKTLGNPLFTEIWKLVGYR